MRCFVGNLPYSVVLVRGYVMDGETPCLGLSDFDTQTIYISDVPVLMGRVQTLLHEVMECWIHHCGQPADKETLCDFVATAMGQFVMEVLASPGVMMSRLRGKGSAVETRNPARARQTEVTCDGARFRLTMVEPVR